MQEAKYSDQIKSNLVIDWKGNHALRKIGIETLRSYLTVLYPDSLPQIEDSILANTIGISLILFYKNSMRNYVPYMLPRTWSRWNKKKKLAVFEGGYHCTVSSVVQWTEGGSFNVIFADVIYERLIELGIEKKDVRIMLPLALCREFLRAGKPQIFFAGVTTLSEKDLVNRRKAAFKRQKSAGKKIKMKDKHLKISDVGELEEVKRHDFTLEAIANLHYAINFIKQYDFPEG